MTTKIAIIGCGNRGADVYALHLAEAGAEIAYLVDPRPARLAEVAARHGLEEAQCFTHWDNFFALGRVVDAVVIATPDHLHVEPALKALALGYDVLLEKPICLSEAELDVLLQAEAASSGRVTVCHVLRTSPFFREVKAVIDSGELGQLIGIVQAENVAFWHFAHSYVRGNWRESPPAAPFILAKSCHDLDVLRWFAAAPAMRVASEGELHHFRPEHAPEGAAERCVDCTVNNCLHDARRVYSQFPLDVWPTAVLTAGGESLSTALEHGRYGECVYLGRNNVVDHQSVSTVFANGVKADLVVSAFTHNNTRTLKVQGSHGELRGHMERGELELHNFRDGSQRTWTVSNEGVHGGGDIAMAAAWLASVRGETSVPTPLAESLDSHRMAFAAERARLGKTVVSLL